MKIAATFPQVLFLSFVLSVPFQCALANGKPHLVEQQPIFDTSLMESRAPFKLEIKHTQYLFPEDPSLLLHGQAGVVDLRGKRKNQMLRGRVAQDNRDSTIKTLQYGVKSHFHADLRKLTAKSAPELSWLMDTQLAEARRKLAGQVAREAQLMNRQLKSPQPQAELPSMPRRANASPDESRALQAELAKSSQRDQRASASQLFRAAVSQAQEHAERVPTVPSKQFVIPSSGRAVFPGSPIPPAPKIDTSASERELSGQLARAKGQLPLVSRMGVELESARRRSRSLVSQAQPAMNAIMTSLRPIAHRDVPTASTAKQAEDRDTESVIQWDAWHARFANLARQPILEEVSKAGSPSGTSTVEITVWPNHHLAVHLTQKSNAAFDQAIVKAYQSLDGNPALEYPAGSRRSSVTFLIDNKHNETGVPSSVKSQTSVGDKEIVRHHP